MPILDSAEVASAWNPSALPAAEPNRRGLHNAAVLEPQELDAISAEANGLSELLGMNLMVVDAQGRRLGRTSADLLDVLPNDVLKRLATTDKVSVVCEGGDLLYFSIPLHGRGIRTLAVGYTLAKPGLVPSPLKREAMTLGWSNKEFADWLEKVPYCHPDVLHQFLCNAERDLKKRGNEGLTRLNCDAVVALAHNVQVSQTARQLAEIALDQLERVSPADGQIVLITPRGESPIFSGRGLLPFDENSFHRFVAQFESQKFNRSIAENHIAGTARGKNFPFLTSFVLAPITDRNQHFGWLCTCNSVSQTPFPDALSDVVHCLSGVLGTHVRNLELFAHQGELLLSFVRSLVFTLDAKDPYTRGHSERVALIARRLGEEMGLSEDDLGDIYLSGLLHDIGKIGVDDRILRKPDALTADEFAEVKKHPVIGDSILSGLKNLQVVLPGVRSHHEAWSGGGYPDGLVGENIPLMARIIAVADSYDAITSDRPYRAGLPLQVLESIFTKDGGKQWDPSIVACYFSARDSIRRVFAEYPNNTAQFLMPKHLGALRSV